MVRRGFGTRLKSGLCDRSAFMFLPLFHFFVSFPRNQTTQILLFKFFLSLLVAEAGHECVTSATVWSGCHGHTDRSTRFSTTLVNIAPGAFFFFLSLHCKS